MIGVLIRKVYLDKNIKEECHLNTKIVMYKSSRQISKYTNSVNTLITDF